VDYASLICPTGYGLVATRLGSDGWSGMQIVDQAEYARMKDFFAFYVGRYLDVKGLPAEKTPMASLADLEKKSPKKAFNGLRQAINDCVEMSFHLHHQEVEKLDSELRTRGIVTLSELRRRYSKRYARVTERGRIKDETEYYLVRSILHDPTAKSPEECRLLEGLISDYEAA
jgi:hypothetical protein